LSYSQRKQDHINLALKEKNVQCENGLSKLRLIHEALPELNWDDVHLSTSFLGRKVPTPFFVSSMTGGFSSAVEINSVIAKACAGRGWMMGVGSQRKGLENSKALEEWIEIKNKFPEVLFLGNLGLSQLIHTPLEKVETLVRALGAVAMVIHTNSLQECLQPEGTPRFKGGLESLKGLSENLSVPVILKETGCGFSYKTLESLCGLGLKAVDISGYGGTHWGRIEGQRSLEDSIQFRASQTFALWGNSTIKSLYYAKSISPDYKIWASGGIRSGLDAAKSIALGADAVGFAMPALQKAIQGGMDLLIDWMGQIEYELKIALFCLGATKIKDIKGIKNDLS